MTGSKAALIVVGAALVGYLVLSRTSGTTTTATGINPLTGMPYGAINPATGLPYGQVQTGGLGIAQVIAQSTASIVSSLSNLLNSGRASTPGLVPGTNASDTSNLVNNVPTSGNPDTVQSNPGDVSSVIGSTGTDLPGQDPQNSDLIAQATADGSSTDVLTSLPYPFLNDPSTQVSIGA